MKKIDFKFNWMSLFFLAPVGALWFLFFISRVTTFPLPLDIAITYSLPFLIGMALMSLKIKGLYWWEWVEITLTFKKFKKIKKRI